jgi:hypothetical protein
MAGSVPFVLSSIKPPATYAKRSEAYVVTFNMPLVTEICDTSASIGLSKAMTEVTPFHEG